MKNFRKSKKALSPVVASIILIAVTVAVSIAVAAWMGALTIGFMGTEELRITSMKFVADDTGEPVSIDLTVSNIGTSPVTITIDAFVNGEYALTEKHTFEANEGGTVSILYAKWEQGDNYQVKISSSKGNTFTYTAVAPN